MFDLDGGLSYDSGERTFDSGLSYDIHIQVESGDGAGTWATWSGAGNLGSDDRIVLAGTGADVQGAAGGAVQSFATAFGGASWNTLELGSAAFLPVNGGFSRITEAVNTVDLRSGIWALNPNAGGTTNQGHLTTMPIDILTSQGLA